VFIKVFFVFFAKFYDNQLKKAGCGGIFSFESSPLNNRKG